MQMNSVRVNLVNIVSECGSRIVEIKKNSAQNLAALDKDEQLGAHFSTKADRESQELGIERFNKAFPGEIIIAEENENDPTVPPDCIVFDPLDGTAGFYNGINNWGVTACMLRNGKPFACATYFARNGAVVSAGLNDGCYNTLRDRGLEKLQIPAWHGQIDKTMFGTDVGPWVHKSRTFETVLKPLSERHNILSSMAAIEGGRQVLSGELGAYYNIGIAKIWDAAALALAITEAGGVACGPAGNPIQWNTLRCDWIVAGNQQLADIVLEHTALWAKGT